MVTFLELTLPILIAGIAISIMSIITFFYIRHIKKRLFWSESGSLLLEVDIKKRRIRLQSMNILISKAPILKVSKIYTGQWISIELFNEAFNPETNKRLRNAFYRLEKQKTPFEKFEAFPEGAYDRSIKMHISITRSQENFYVFDLSWKTEIKNKMYDTLKNINKSDIVKKEERFQAFIMFALSNLSNRAINEFLKTIPNFIPNRIRKKINYFEYKGRVVFNVASNSFSFLKKLENYAMSKFGKEVAKKGIASMLIGAKFGIVENINTPFKLESALKDINFYLNHLVISRGTNLLKYNLMSKKEFEKIYNLFHYHIKTGEVESKNLLVKKYPSNKSTILYSTPSIKGLGDKNIREIMVNPYEENRIIDIHSQIAFKESKAAPRIIDINDYWLLNNFKNIKRKNIIYMIRLSGSVEPYELLNIVKSLDEKKIYCGIRIKKSSSDVVTFITRIKPRFIIIDEVIAKNIGDTKIRFQLESIAEISTKFGCQLIFENPTFNVDKNIIKKVFLKNYYKY